MNDKIVFALSFISLVVVYRVIYFLAGEAGAQSFAFAMILLEILHREEK